MPSAADEAREHLASAEKALKPSWMSLKFGADHLTASMEFTHAATKFRAANMLPESVHAWSRAGEMKEELRDLFGAGRAYESAGGICDGSGPGGSAAAVTHWQRAIKCFRLAGKGETAAKLILKLATIREQNGDVAGTKAAYDDTIEVYTQDEKEYNLGDVYKQYIGFLVRANQYEDALKTIDSHIALLSRQKQPSFIFKEALAKVVLCIHMGDNVRAEEALNTPCEVDGWYTSKECMVGSEMVQAFKDYDADAVQRLLKEQVWSFLQIEIARMAKQLRVPTIAAPPVKAAPKPTPAPVVATPEPRAETASGGYQDAETAAPVAATEAAVDAVEESKPAEPQQDESAQAQPSANRDDLADLLM